VKKNTVMVDLADENAGGVPGLAPRLRNVPIDSQHLEIKYTVPEDTTVKSLAGKEVSLHVVIKEARERKQPAIDDEMAKDTGEADTLDELKKKIQDRLVEQDKQRIKQELSSQLIKEIVKRNDFPVAPALVDRHAESMVKRAVMQLQMAGIDLEQNEGFDSSKMKEEMKGEAEEAARASILLQAIAEREGVEVSDADLQKRVAELATARQENSKKLRAELERSGSIHGVRSQLLQEKTLDMLLSQAKISDEDPERLIITPEEAGSRLVLTPDEAREEAARAQQIEQQVDEAEAASLKPRRKKP
jgi:trigger factor